MSESHLQNPFVHVTIPVEGMALHDSSDYTATYVHDQLTILIASMPLQQGPDDAADRLFNLVHYLYNMEKHAQLGIHEAVDAATDPESGWLEVNGTDAEGEHLFWIMGFLQTFRGQDYLHYLRLTLPNDDETPFDRVEILKSCNETFRPLDNLVYPTTASLQQPGQ